MIILLNGPLGIGKSTFAEALGEAIDGCVTLFGDALAAFNPTPEDEAEQVHATIALLVGHHRGCGYRHFVIEHYWPNAAALDDLRVRVNEVDPTAEIRCFLLTLPSEENLERIRRRQEARAIDEREHEAKYFALESRALASAPGGTVGEPFDVSDPPDVLVQRMLALLGLA